MATSFLNARENLWVKLTTISGIDCGDEFYAWYDLYTNEFCKQLSKSGFNTDAEYSEILTRINEYSHVGEFLFDEDKQLADLAAFGLVLFERIIQAIANQASHETVFDMHEELAECLSYVVAGTGARGMARKAALARHAADPKQLDKVLIRECWDEWQKKPDRYEGKAAFARDMLDKFPTLKSQPVIAGWCKKWESEV